MDVKSNVSVNPDHVIPFLENVYLMVVWMDIRVTPVVTYAFPEHLDAIVQSHVIANTIAVVMIPGCVLNWNAKMDGLAFIVIKHVL